MRLQEYTMNIELSQEILPNDVRHVFGGWRSDGTKWLRVLRDTSADDIIRWLQSDLATDSENSVLALVLWWYAYDAPGRVEAFIERILPFVAMSGLRRPYVEHVVPGYPEPVRSRVLELCAGGHWTPKRTIYNNPNIVAYNTRFRVQDWTREDAYYSTPALVHGYEVYTFLKCKSLEGRNEMVVYTRCSGPYITAHRLKVTIKYAVLDDGPDEIPVMQVLNRNVTFTRAEQSCGVFITHEGITWDDVVAGNTRYTYMREGGLMLRILVVMDFTETDDHVPFIARHHDSDRPSSG